MYDTQAEASFIVNSLDLSTYEWNLAFDGAQIRAL